MLSATTVAATLLGDRYECVGTVHAAGRSTNVDRALTDSCYHSSSDRRDIAAACVPSGGISDGEGTVASVGRSREACSVISLRD